MCVSHLCKINSQLCLRLQLKAPTKQVNQRTNSNNMIECMDTGFSEPTIPLANIYLAKVQVSCHIVCRIPAWIDPQGNPTASVQIKPGGDQPPNYQLPKVQHLLWRFDLDEFETYYPIINKILYSNRSSISALFRAHNKYNV